MRDCTANSTTTKIGFRRATMLTSIALGNMGARDILLVGGEGWFLRRFLRRYIWSTEGATYRDSNWPSCNGGRSLTPCGTPSGNSRGGSRRMHSRGGSGVPCGVLELDQRDKRDSNGVHRAALACCGLSTAALDVERPGGSRTTERDEGEGRRISRTRQVGSRSGAETATPLMALLSTYKVGVSQNLWAVARRGNAERQGKPYIGSRECPGLLRVFSGYSDAEARGSILVIVSKQYDGINPT
ncbi:hypothetical protein GGX14DRAFT_404497 [Mycena pura]|uniref:Uncharacterized protein n=1 Tax=Mycena pura TaxID=153505 RepID=A0AAD6UVR2_9AGAR|nr:hypothetical protein GGX14DRAFT_404497 [Mycena pura]